MSVVCGCEWPLEPVGRAVSVNQIFTFARAIKEAVWCENVLCVRVLMELHCQQHNQMDARHFFRSIGVATEAHSGALNWRTQCIESHAHHICSRCRVLTNIRAASSVAALPVTAATAAKDI